LGYIISGGIIKSEILAMNTSTVKVSPVIILGADYDLTDNFSLGVHFSTQCMKGKVNDNT
jgi:hypothetical protein